VPQAVLDAQRAMMRIVSTGQAQFVQQFVVGIGHSLRRCFDLAPEGLNFIHQRCRSHRSPG
jgi:hypothetical protein